MQTDKGYLHIYHVHVSNEPAMAALGLEGVRDPCKADIYLRHTARLDPCAAGTCLSGDSKMLMVGCTGGIVQLASWVGKVRCDMLAPGSACPPICLPSSLGVMEWVGSLYLY
jgi:hypothetical protein